MLVRKMFHRVADAWIRHGPKQFVGLALKNVAALPKITVERLRRHPAEFDINLGIDTDGACSVGALDLDPRSESTRNATRYEATHISMFKRVLSSAPIDPRDFSFIDYGSGKGRVLILAAHFPFQKVIGIELSPSLHKIAEENIHRAAERTHLACTDVRSICGDATQFNPPDGPLVCYLYNPFGSLIVQRVMDRLEQSLRVAPRPIFILYVNPVHNEVIAASTCFQVVEQNSDFCTFRSTAP